MGERMDTVLLTGATGFLGTEIAAALAAKCSAAGSEETEINKVYVLVRAADDEAAYHRIREAWNHDAELYSRTGTLFIPVRGDFTRPNLGLGSEDLKTLLDEVTLVIHAGAEVGFQKSSEELEKTNTYGTANVIHLAKRMNILRRLVYVSTAYVSGQTKGHIMEEPAGTQDNAPEDKTVGKFRETVFSNYYEKSKAEAEALVRSSGLPFSVVRPGMIVGDSRTGWVRTFNTVYYMLKMLLLGRLRVIPAGADTLLNIVPGDYVAECTVKVSFSEEAAGRTFHLTCSESMSPCAGELAEYVRDWAKKNLATDVPRPVFVPLQAAGAAGLRYGRKKGGKRKTSTTNMLTLAPYFAGGKSFDRTNADSICGEYDLDWHDYIDKLLTFACRKNFMRQTGQTVFEQAMVRRESTRYPVKYFDVTSDGIIMTTGPEVNRKIEKVKAALWSEGIRRGDRVALTGINSVDYLVLEQAIGLLGAVSVPIYYTTPAREASMLLERSGAKWFFIGDKRMMSQVDQIETSARIISFSAADNEQQRNDKVMKWSVFLGHTLDATGEQYPRREDLATIRYTSGTTGDPKGVTFDFGQLAWMGEVLTNLLEWKDRNDTMKYLSFLPLSHVVEGILASYAPYYVLCDVEYYYLNDFGALTDALPKVRPNVFFSVPRFYEKLWDQLSSNRLGQAWLAAEDGPAREAMAAVLRRAVLRKAGLDRCKQLIVGSAPISEALLLNFRKLGIEIYNAYGQTEAPLITINRFGDNVIPTIGTPLPDTVVTAEPDGELIVEGPQVTLGYYGMESPSIQNGVLRTGDLGTIGEDGHITLFGRKKDMIVTAYGKNISIPKLEEKLKDIRGVSEAVLIGEKRAYCTALLWLEEPGDPDEDTRRIAAAIEEMNAGLSHPEQIRKFRIIPRPLSIQAEELTPNLKVKRGNVEAHFAEEIEEMYK